MNATAQAGYEEKIRAEAAFWDREFLAADGPPPFACLFHHSPYFRERLREPIVRTILGRLGPGKSALDLGCGMGWLSLRMAETGATVRGVDVAEGCIDAANLKARRRGLERCSFGRFDANRDELPAEAYDLVVAWGALHHLANLDHAVAQAARAIRPGGTFIVMECIEHSDLRARIAAAIADALHMALPTDRTYGQKLRHAWGKIFGGRQEFEWSPFENVGGGKWTDAVLACFEAVERREFLCFLSPFAARVRMPEPALSWTLGSLYALDRALIRIGALRGEHRFMILRRRGGSAGPG